MTYLLVALGAFIVVFFVAGMMHGAKQGDTVMAGRE